MFCYRLTHADVPALYIILSAVTGGICALFASLTATYFRYGRNG